MATWDAEAGSANWQSRNVVNGDSAAGSGFPETKDDRSGTLGGEEESAGEANDWRDSRAPRGLPESEQAMTQGPVSEPSPVVIAGKSGAVSDSTRDGGGGGAAGSASGTAAPASATSGVNGVRRHAMAFEIARVERFGETFPPASLEKAKRVWDLSRPRYSETAEPETGGMRRIRVPPGKECAGAVPYGVWSTSWAQMGDFGLDIGMYFVTIAQLIGAVLVYAALCIVAIIHFSSENYSNQVRFNALPQIVSCRCVFCSSSNRESP